MKDPVFSQIYHFYKARFPQGGKLLLAISGGGDSMALLHLTKECMALLPLRAEVVHVNHNWREESGREATLLQEKVESLGIPFHSCSVEEAMPSSNIEAFFRTQRYRLFRKVADSICADALVTAHQRDDLAETVLKRILEGASLANLCGIREEKSLYGMRVLRPLLELQRAQLCRYLQRKAVAFFQDPTNEDTRYTRARMRHHIVPELEKTFGKNAVDNLCRLGQESGVYNDALQEKLAPHLEATAGELALDACRNLPEHEMRYLIHTIFPALSADEKTTLCRLIRQGDSGKKVRNISVHKDRLTW